MSEDEPVSESLLSKRRGDAFAAALRTLISVWPTFAGSRLRSQSPTLPWILHSPMWSLPNAVGQRAQTAAN